MNRRLRRALLRLAGKGAVKDKSEKVRAVWDKYFPDGDNHVCDYGDFRVTHWRPNREYKPISE